MEIPLHSSNLKYKEEFSTLVVLSLLPGNILSITLILDNQLEINNPTQGVC